MKATDLQHMCQVKFLLFKHTGPFFFFASKTISSSFLSAGRVQNYGSEKTLRWEPKTGQAFTSGGVVYRLQDGSLQVNETGFFQIYSRVEFIFKKCSPATVFEHLVFKKRAKKPSSETLMVARRVGFCPQPQHSWTTESYLGSAHHLEQGDRVFVNVSHPNILSHSHYGNFFGLYKI